ncbi:MAG: adenine phosphoribosyltransferase [Lachnospiraceae bacterium]|nr:adenine phosphoribosyltransferase [Lachnospiraceae bacterium]MDY2957185.1 adenine phosphoribosyltransferase [Lachnospiraceae bacterium]
MKTEEIKSLIRDIYDFPKKGIIFRDITTLLKDADGLKMAVDAITDAVKDLDFDYVVAPEARGFIFGVPVSYNLGKGFIPIRKKGKLPCETIAKEYGLEYGNSIIEIHKDAVKPGDKVIIVDDLMATGGTTKAMADLLEEIGADVVKIVCLLELEDLNGKEAVKDYNYEGIVKY